jgi:hypothetical protein
MPNDLTHGFLISISEDRRCGALEGITEVMRRLDDTTRRLSVSGSARELNEAHGAAQLAMVFNEAVRQVTGLPARGDGSPRPAHPDDQLVEERESLAAEALSRIETDERERERDP